MFKIREAVKKKLGVNIFLIVGIVALLCFISNTLQTFFVDVDSSQKSFMSNTVKQANHSVLENNLTKNKVIQRKVKNKPTQIKNTSTMGKTAPSKGNLYDLKQSLEKNDVCNIRSKIWGYADRLRALLDHQVQNTPVDLKYNSFLGYNQVYSGEPQSLDNFIITDFHNGLIYGDLMVGLENTTGDQKSKVIDLSHALSIFNRLENNDPQNGAHTYMKVAILQKLGMEKSILKTELLKMFKKPKFNTFYIDIARRLYEIGLKNSAHYLVATSTIAHLPVPDMVPTFKLINKISRGDQDQEFTRSAIEFSKLLMKPGFKSNGEFEFVSWSAVEFIFGYVIKFVAWNVAYPNSKGPKKMYSKELLRSKFNKNVFAQHVYQENLYRIEGINKDFLTYKDGKNCKREIYDSYYHQANKEYEKFVVREKKETLNQPTQEALEGV